MAKERCCLKALLVIDDGKCFPVNSLMLLFGNSSPDDLKGDVPIRQMSKDSGHKI